MFNFVATTRFKTSKPYLLKKIIITAVVLALFVYLIATRGIVEIIVLSISLFLMSALGGRKRNDEGFFKGIFSSYKNMFKKYVVDDIPVVFDADDEKIEFTLFKAELFGNKIINEKYFIAKNDVGGVLCFDEDNSIIITFNKANVFLASENKKYNKNIQQQKSSVMFYLTKELFDEFVVYLREKGYCVTVSGEEKAKYAELEESFKEDLIPENEEE